VGGEVKQEPDDEEKARRRRLGGPIACGTLGAAIIVAVIGGFIGYRFQPTVPGTLVGAMVAEAIYGIVVIVTLTLYEGLSGLRRTK
jgi:hypothetical protein